MGWNACGPQAMSWVWMLDADADEGGPKLNGFIDDEAEEEYSEEEDDEESE